MILARTHRTLAVLFAAAPFVLGSTSYWPAASGSRSIWNAASLFVGAEVRVRDATTPVTVTWQTNQGGAIGSLYFVEQRNGNTEQFLFHNSSDLYPDEGRSVNLGLFPTGSLLVFMYKVVDTTSVYESIHGKKLYSGQNRDGIDQFVSQVESHLHGRSWAVAGSVSQNSCEVSFGALNPGSFREVRFHVSNAYLQK